MNENSFRFKRIEGLYFSGAFSEWAHLAKSPKDGSGSLEASSIKILFSENTTANNSG